MEINPVGWFEIYVQDLQRAKAFYETVLQVPMTKLENIGLELWCFPMHKDRPGATGALIKMEGMDSGKNSVIVYFVCADCAVEASRVEKAGGKVFKEKFSIGPYGFISLAYDTEGNMFGLHSME